MPEPDTPLPPGNTEAKLLLVAFFVVVGSLLFVILLDRFPPAVIPTIYALPAALAVSLF